MKSTGIVRKVDNLGRLVIPKEIRRIFGIDSQQGMEIHVEGSRIIINKYHHKCVLCDCTEGLSPINDKLICRSCTGQISQSARKAV